MMLGSIARRLSERMPAGGFLRHAFAISSGVAVAQAIVLLTSPIITRIYSPAVFGTVATLASFAVIGVVIASLRFEAAIPIAKSDEEALSLTALALVCGTLFSVVAAVVMLIAPLDLLAAAGFPEEVWELRWLIPVLVITSVYQIAITQFGTYRRAYAALASAQVVQSSVSSGVKIGLGLLTPTVAGLVLGELARRTLGIGTIVRRSGLRLHDLLRQCTVQGLRATALVHRRYPIFVLPASLLNTISLQAPIMILAAHFSTVESGLYALGLAAVQVPLSLVESGVSNAFISRIREYERSGRLAEVMTKMVQALALVTAPWFALCSAWGPELMSVAFGAEWREGGTYLALLSPWLFIGFVFSACGMVLWARDRQGAELGWQVAFVTLRLTALELGSRSGSAAAAVASFGAASFVVLTAHSWWLLRVAQVPVSPSLLYALRELVAYFLLAFATRYVLLEVVHAGALLGVIVTALLVGVLALWRIRTHGALGSV